VHLLGIPNQAPKKCRLVISMYRTIWPMMKVWP
jgi:hypothetical protein